MDTIWIDVNIGNTEHDEDGNSKYIPKITQRIELTKLHKILSTGLDSDFNELKYQFMRTLKKIKRDMEISEHSVGIEYE